MTELTQELEVAVAAAVAAGDEVARMRREGLRFGRKDGWELVSEADVRAAEMLHDHLRAAFPGDGWLSEEHDDGPERLACDRVWIVDPVDGTREYLQGIPEYAISVALAIRGEATLGVVHNPATGELFAASCVGAAERPPETLPRRFSVLVGRGEHHWDEVPPLPPGAKTTGVGSVAYRLARVAAGYSDAVLTNYGRSEWDVAAGVALCRAAGLRATGTLGGPIPLNQRQPVVRGLLAAAPGLHAHLLSHFERLARRHLE